MKTLEEWKRDSPKTLKLISRYVPSDKTLWFKDKTLKPLTKHQQEKAIHILYEAYRKGVSLKKLWHTSKDFIYALVSKQLKGISYDKLKDWFGFTSVWGGEWNNPDFKKHFSEAKKYPVIFKSTGFEAFCLCGTKIEHMYYAYNPSVKITFRIGSECAGNCSSVAMRRCMDCFQVAKYMRKEYPVCSSCVQIRRYGQNRSYGRWY